VRVDYVSSDSPLDEHLERRVEIVDIEKHDWFLLNANLTPGSHLHDLLKGTVTSRKPHAGSRGGTRSASVPLGEEYRRPTKPRNSRPSTSYVRAWTCRSSRSDEGEVENHDQEPLCGETRFETNSQVSGLRLGEDKIEIAPTALGVIP